MVEFCVPQQNVPFTKCRLHRCSTTQHTRKLPKQSACSLSYSSLKVAFLPRWAIFARPVANLGRTAVSAIQNAGHTSLIGSPQFTQSRDASGCLSVFTHAVSLRITTHRKIKKKKVQIFGNNPNKNSINEEIKNRPKSGNVFYHPVRYLLSSSLLSNNLKIKIYRTTILPAALYGRETWSLILQEERWLRVFENRVLRGIYGPKREEVTGGMEKTT